MGKPQTKGKDAAGKAAQLESGGSHAAGATKAGANQHHLQANDKLAATLAQTAAHQPQPKAPSPSLKEEEGRTPEKPASPATEAKRGLKAQKEEGTRRSQDLGESVAAAAGLSNLAASAKLEPAQAQSATGKTTQKQGIKEGGRTGKSEDPGLASRLQVLDQRRLQDRHRPESEAVQAPTAAPAKEQHSRDESKATHELLLDLGKPSALATGDKGGVFREATATGQNFAAMLADRLRDSGNTEIVQSARIVLKDGDSGSIRMRLNPPELGHVKIELHLADNSISGRIVVESDAARSAFEKGLSSLQDAFRAGGFESAKLEVQVGSGDVSGQGNWNGGQPGGEGSQAPFWSERSRSAAFEPSSAGMASRPTRADRSVDIVV